VSAATARDLKYTDADDMRWWRPDVPDGERNRSLLECVDRICSANEWRKHQFERAMRLYAAVPPNMFGVGGTAQMMTRRNNRLSLNVVKNCSDSFVSIVTKDEPKISFVTEGGDWGMQQRAKKLEKFIEGQFYESKVFARSPLVVLDGGGLFGTGWLKAFIRGTGEKARIVIERVAPWEIQIDEQDGQYGDPKAVYQRKWIDRFVLMSQFRDEPEKLEAIRRVKKSIDPHSGVTQPLTQADQILVTEAWRLPSDEGEDDGRHCIVIPGCDLVDEPWEYSWFPFVSYTRQDAPFGAWGISIADDLEGIQYEINNLMMQASRGMRLCGAAHVLIEQGSEVNFSAWDNETGSKIEYLGVKPEIYVPTNVVPPELYPQVDRLRNSAYELTGIPQAAAQGMPAPNLESGKAQEIALTISDRRLIVAIKNYHEMFRRLALIVLELGRVIAEENPKYAVRVADKRGGMKKIFLSEADMRDDEYVVKLWPTNGLADEPAARMGQVEKMADAGWLAPDEAKRLLDMPDLEEANNLENASYNAVEGIISEILDEGRYTEPVPLLNIAQAQKQVQFAWIRAWRANAPQDRLALLQDFLEALGELAGGIGQPQAPAQQASAGGTPVAAAPAPGVTPMMQGAPAAPPAPQGPAAPPGA
jgi:hypothetical protein